jgi:hypothetical protein
MSIESDMNLLLAAIEKMEGVIRNPRRVSTKKIKAEDKRTPIADVGKTIREIKGVAVVGWVSLYKVEGSIYKTFVPDFETRLSNNPGDRRLELEREQLPPPKKPPEETKRLSILRMYRQGRRT